MKPAQISMDHYPYNRIKDNLMLQAPKGIITIILMIATLVVYLTLGLLFAIPLAAATVIFFIMNFTSIGALSANRKIGKFTFNAIKEEGIKRIRNGTFHVSESSFSEGVEKIRDILSEQQYVPEFGRDGMFIHFSSEHEANSALEKILSRGLKADTVIDRRTWLVKIEF